MPTEYKEILPDQDTLNALILGASRGIGLGFVKLLLQEQRTQRVFATYRNEGDAEGLLALRAEHRERLVCLKMDVTDERLVESAFKQIGENVEALDLALYCVGMLHEDNLSPEKSLRDANTDNLLRSFQINSIGAVLAAKHLVSLYKRDTPSIYAAISAKVGSIGDNRLGGWYGYRASKAALNMFLKTIAIEYRRRCPSTVVVSLHPGTTDTRLSKPFQSNVPERQLSTVEETVRLLADVIADLTLEDSGEFYSWDGNRLPW